VILDLRGSTVLSEDACRCRLARAAAPTGTGRIAINGARSPHVIPVNFTMVASGIVVRLGPGWAASHLDGAAVTFEADEVSARRRTGWSVVVEGVARVIPYDDVGRVSSNFPTPIVTSSGISVFEIIPFKVTGRGVEPDIRGEQHDLVAGAPDHADEPTKALSLGREAAEELATVLRSVLGDLSAEIADTGNANFRRELRETRRLLDGIAAQLTSSGAN
jgi:hypothetical protein